MIFTVSMGDTGHDCRFFADIFQIGFVFRRTLVRESSLDRRRVLDLDSPVDTLLGHHDRALRHRRGFFTSVSSNGRQNPIVWAVDRPADTNCELTPGLTTQSKVQY